MLAFFLIMSILQKIKQKFPGFSRYRGTFFLSLVFIIVYFLVHRHWDTIPLLFLFLTAIPSILFATGWNRVGLVTLIGLTGITERHFILHYRSNMREAGSQALITLQITDADEISTYLSQFFFIEYFLVLLFCAGVTYFIIDRKNPSLKKQYAGCIVAWFCLLVCIGYNIFPPAREYLLHASDMKEYYKNYFAHKFEAKDMRAEQQKEFAILVIGESNRFDEMERLFSEQELPFLCKARSEGKLFSFSDMITCYPQTYFSVFSLLSRRSTDSTNPYWPQHGLLTLFREAGWHVCYLTYQDKKKYEYGYDAVVGEGDEYINHLHTSGQKLDTGMLPIIQEKLRENTGKLLIVIKMNSCHFPCSSYKRYPDSARKYIPDGRGEKTNPESGKPEDIVMMKNAYRNAILFSGKLIDTFFETVSQEQIPGLILFLSDHGINNYDDGKNAYFGKSKSCYHIPAYLYLNDAYRNQLLTEQINENLRTHADAPITNSYVFDTLENLAGISDPNHREEYDMTSANFVPQAERMVWAWNQMIKYDDL